MLTRHRRDLTAEEFHTVKRFKHYFLKWGWERNYRYFDDTIPAKPTRINVRLYPAQPALFPLWHQKNGAWEQVGFRKVVDMVYFISVREFRWMCRHLQFDDGSVGIAEGRMVDLLVRFGLLAFTEEKRHKWLIEGQPHYGLEEKRMSSSGTIGKIPEAVRRYREEEAKKRAQDEEDLRHAREMVDGFGISLEEALRIVRMLRPTGDSKPTD